MTAARQIWVILWKDLVIDLRRKENILAMFFFALLTLMIFNFAMGGEEAGRFRLTPRALAGLEQAGYLGGSAHQLAPMLGRTYSTQKAFLQALAGLEGLSIEPEERIALIKAGRREFLQESAPGVLWVVFLLAGVLGLSKSFGQEKENGCMDGLLLTPVSRGVIYLGKMGSNALFLIILLMLLLPVFSLLFRISLWGVLQPLMLVLLGGVVGFCALGTLLGGITSSLRGQEVLLPLLLFPLITPVLIVVVHLTKVIVEGTPLDEEMGWINLLIAADALYLVISYLVFDYAMEA